MTLKDAQELYPVDSTIWVDENRLARVVAQCLFADGTITLSAVSYPDPVDHFSIVVWPEENLPVKVPLSAT